MAGADRLVRSQPECNPFPLAPPDVLVALPEWKQCQDRRPILMGVLNPLLKWHGESGCGPARRSHDRLSVGASAQNGLPDK